MVPVSVKTFRARGNGASDDTAAIQAAINNTSGVLIFPAGVYKITADITINNESLVLRGEGVLLTFNGKKLIVTACEAIEGLTFDQVGIVLKSNLNSTNSVPITIQRNIIKNIAGSPGIFGEKVGSVTPNKVLIKDNFFGACASSISGDFNDSTIRDNRMIGAPLAIANPSNSLIMVNNTVEGRVFPVRGRGRWVARKANFMGDSNTMDRVDMPVYPVCLKRDLGFGTINNYGIGGTLIADKTGADTTAMVHRVQTMDATAEFIMVMGGGNDFDQAVPMGVAFTEAAGAKTRNLNPTTFYGALNLMCERLIARYPDRTVILSTPVKVHGLSPALPRDYEQNTLGLYREEYIKAIKDVGAWYGLPVFDLWTNGGMQPSLAAHSIFYFPDLRHLAALGHERVAERLMAFVDASVGL